MFFTFGSFNCTSQPNLPVTRVMFPNSKILPWLTLQPPFAIEFAVTAACVNTLYKLPSLVNTSSLHRLYSPPTIYLGRDVVRTMKLLKSSLLLRLKCVYLLESRNTVVQFPLSSSPRKKQPPFANGYDVAWALLFFCVYVSFHTFKIRTLNDKSTKLLSFSFCSFTGQRYQTKYKTIFVNNI